MRPWAKERGIEPWLDAAQHRMKLLGQRASGTETMFPYQMAHERMRKAAGRRPSAAAWPAIRQLVSAGKPGYSIRTPDQVAAEHHDAIIDSANPIYHEETQANPNTPKVYALRNTAQKSTIFLVPLVHNASGQTGWVRGRSDQEPSQWRMYRDSEIADAVAGHTPKGRRKAAQPAEERYVRQRATGKPPEMVGEGDRLLDEEGHQIVEPRRDLWTEPEGIYPWDFNWERSGEHSLKSLRDEWWRAPTL
jgi:hypothetical protein